MDASEPSGGKFLSATRRFGKLSDGLGHSRGIPGGHQNPTPTLVKHFNASANGGSHAWQFGGHRFQQGVGMSLALAG
jgi:hypothetical protein